MKVSDKFLNRCQLLYSSTIIFQAIDNLSKNIITAKCFKNNSKLVVITILEGGMIFSSDLIMNKNMRSYFDIFNLSVHSKTYINNKKTKKAIIDLRHISYEDIHDNSILIVDDIYDTGETIENLKHELISFQPKLVKSCVLLRKKDISKTKPDFWALECNKDEFVLGYGLDYDGLYRNISHIYSV